MDVFSAKDLFSKQVYIGGLASRMGFDQKLCSHPNLPPSELGHDTTPGVQFLSFRPNAPKIIMIISGTHGVEGPAGYDLQMKLLENREHEKLPADTGLVLVVALNPLGWAHGWRTNENRVDLNRNGWSDDFPSETPPFTPEIATLVHPEKCDERWYRALAEQLDDPSKCASLRAQVFRGQDADPKGIFYGGMERAWSLQILDDYCKSFAKTCKHLAVLDIHTGLGGFGEIMLISSARPGDDKLIARVKSWFGLTPVFPKLGQTDRVNAVSSDLLFFIAQCLPETEVTALAVEIGTISFEEGFPFFVAENHLHHNPGEIAYLNQGSPRANYDYVHRGFKKIWYPPAIDQLWGQQWSTAALAGFMPIFRTVTLGLSLSKLHAVNTRC